MEWLEWVKHTIPFVYMGNGYLGGVKRTWQRMKNTMFAVTTYFSPKKKKKKKSSIFFFLF